MFDRPILTLGTAYSMVRTIHLSEDNIAVAQKKKTSIQAQALASVWRVLELRKCDRTLTYAPGNEAFQQV